MISLIPASWEKIGVLALSGNLWTTADSVPEKLYSTLDGGEDSPESI